VRYGGAPSEPTKTGEIRRVELVGMARDALARWQAPDANPHGLVFPRLRGEFRDENHVLRWIAWKDGLKAAGLTRRVRWHDLRHTCASSLISGWWGKAWSLEQVKAQLGHTSIKTTERYAHLAQDSVRRAAEETANVWPRLSQVRESIDPTRVFLNRRSYVRSVPGAPSETTEESGDESPPAAGRLLAVAEALLLSASEGREGDAYRLAEELRGVGLTGAIELAEAVLAAGPSARRAGANGGAS
jgi:hypothetical protein